MGFNGGGSGGTTGVNSHKHTNAVGDGSFLDNTTLLNASTLVTTQFNPVTHLHTLAANSGGILDSTTLLNASTLVSTSFAPLDHLTNTQSKQGGSLVANSSIVTGASITINGVEYPIEVLI
jgi:hypothetical protein